MEFITEPNRIFVREDGELLAEVTYPAAGPDIVVIDHTWVSDRLRGRGVAGQLMERAAAELRRTGRRARLTCSYAVKWWPQHPEYAELLAQP